ncbi:LacI family DNA-binding transcriptional regulator [Shouchella sp. JSM 1781072]|uniref:LacI family DNA-binding transcriptional regulator n=1 Tax=Bacillaceae TaxID=186817 RepID=UPI00159BAC08|nr:LacI family DNA-binding transcriptional regulator [Bacillus sp. Marseille-P3800]
MANMKEVAKVAGVSTITVSRVINTPELVKEKTREKVLKVIGELQYQGNQAAKALVTKKTRVVHIFISQDIQLTNPFAMHFLAGVSDELSKQHYSFLVRREWDYPYKCDGVIAMSVTADQETLLDEKFDVPTVLFGHSFPTYDWVDVNNYQGAYEMVEYLIKLGHKEIGLIVINENRQFVSDRINGYKQALLDYELPFSSDKIEFAENKEDVGYIKTIELFERTQMTALFCMSDELALGAIRAARLLKKNVPHDLSITGFDGLGYELLTDPKITTIHQPVYEVGKELANILVQRIEQPNLTLVQKMISPALKVNNSVFQVIQS